MGGSRGRRRPTTRIADLVPDPENRRRHDHDPRNLDMVRESLRTVGAARSIVIDEGDVIMAGNGVAAAAEAAGISKVRIIEAEGDELIAVRRSGLTPDQKRALAIFDNRTAELAAWDVEQLRIDEASGLSLQPYWTKPEASRLLGAKPGKTDPDAVPLVRSTPIKRGDLFALGDHRVLCGDSTDADDIARAMGGEQAHCIFTDPPYGVAYDGGAKKRATLDNDHIGTDIYSRALPLLALAADDEAALYLRYADGHAASAAAAAAAAAAGYQIVAQVIWAKNHAQFVTSAHYKGKHEPCYYAHKRGCVARWFGPNNEVTLWECKRAPKNEYHPTQKPVEIAVRAISNSSNADHVVLDGFCGGGTTLIACEQTGRRCRALEIEPQYCQVAIDRWEAFSGKRAKRIGRTKS